MKNTDTLIKIAAEMSAIAGSCEWAMGRDDLSDNEKADFVTKKMRELSALQAQADVGVDFDEKAFAEKFLTK
tara:strand:+ start:82 stop:297 length:216 start_codon:yes stop_codon:yes gene_type:complete